ncbi:hypothetical protein A7U60_g5349 [Sanghuangporus baumii]|uniref:Uncharacterized protein n=1 Tax=Sanghuangporus baumii TaxID=108892 RepID=A0A9Q5HWV0_SANBA|nr:hypothetical protein A7U60_g5349 [Sanghuangporus baumii]
MASSPTARSHKIQRQAISHHPDLLCASACDVLTCSPQLNIGTADSTMASRPTDVQTILNYTSPSPNGEGLWCYILRPTPPKPWTNTMNDPRDVVIHDARGREDEFSLDRSGFEFITYPSAVPDLFDEWSIKKMYYPEVVKMLQQHTGASRVMIAGHMHRRSHPGAQTISGFTDITGPAFAVHGDRTMDSAHYLAENQLDVLPKGRRRIINVWRPIGEPVYDVPLAVLDYRTIDTVHDLVPVVVKYAAQDIETLAAFYSEKHMWYYLKNQARVTPRFWFCAKFSF